MVETLNTMIETFNNTIEPLNNTFDISNNMIKTSKIIFGKFEISDKVSQIKKDFLGGRG